MHDFLARDGVGPGAIVVAGLQVGQFLAHELEVVEELALALGVFAGDVGFAEEHEVVDVGACLEEETADGGVCDLVVGYGYGAHVEGDEFFYVVEAVVEGELHAAEDGGYHLLADVVVVLEGPPGDGVPALGAWLADVVEEGCPAEPEVAVVVGGDVVEDFEGVVEVVLVGAAVAHLYAFEGGELGEDDGEETGAGEFDEADTGPGREHDFVEFVDDAFLGDDLDTLGVALEGLLGLVLYLEAELGGEADAAHHAQGVVGEGDVGVEGRSYEAVLHIEESVEAVDELAEAVGVETDGEGIDGKVAAVEVVVEGAVFDDGFA